MQNLARFKSPTELPPDVKQRHGVYAFAETGVSDASDVFRNIGNTLNRIEAFREANNIPRENIPFGNARILADGRYNAVRNDEDLTSPRTTEWLKDIDAKMSATETKLRSLVQSGSPVKSIEE